MTAVAICGAPVAVGNASTGYYMDALQNGRQKKKSAAKVLWRINVKEYNAPAWTKNAAGRLRRIAFERRSNIDTSRGGWGAVDGGRIAKVGDPE